MDEVRNNASTSEFLSKGGSSSFPSTDEKEGRILRKGDLVRIQKIRDSRLTRHDGALGRVSRSIAIDKEERDGKGMLHALENHPFRYDIDLILGGKIPNCHRLDVEYTTAEAEGMTSEGLRKRKRTPTSTISKTNSEPEKVKKSQNSARRKDKDKKDGGEKANARTGKATSKSSKKRKSPTNATGKKNSKNSKNIKESANDNPLENDSIINKDLYEKHKKDFDRSFTRLEKMDHFGFFFEPPPNVVEAESVSTSPKFSIDVNGQSGNPSGQTSSKCQTQVTPDALDAGSENSEKEVMAQLETKNSISDVSTMSSVAPSKSDRPVETALHCPKVNQKCVGLPDPSPLYSKPPLTWDDLRSRRDAGRYILDRLEKLEKERKKRLGPYKWDKRKRRQQLEKDVTKNVERLESHDALSKTTGKVTGKRSLTRNGIRVHPRVLHEKGIDWDLFQADVCAMCKSAIARDPLGASGTSGTLGHAAKKIMQLMEQIYERIAKKHMREMELADARHEFTVLLSAQSNQEAAFQGNWRKTPFPEREYERLQTDVVCAGLSELDEKIASCEKQTVLPDSFVGLSYSYNDTGESEGWMKSVTNKSQQPKNSTNGISDEQKAADALSRDHGVIKAQVRATMEKLLIGVQDKVMTDAGVLKESELRSANWEHPCSDDDRRSTSEISTCMTETIDSSGLTDGRVGKNKSPHLVEQSVWGIDCYTRRNVIICIEKDLDPITAVEFVEKWLLPAINVCPVDVAHDLTNAAKILEGLPLDTRDDDIKNESPATERPTTNERWSHSLFGKALLRKMKNSAPVWLKAAAFQLRRAINSLGHDFFRAHPKGHGSIVLSPLLKANTLVTFYRGEVYPSWRWGEKMDAIDITQKHIGLRPNLPDFYNMALERPQSDPKGYGLMIVDASRKAGHGSMLSHSCDPTCEVRVAALNGKLCLVMTTLRDVELGEELTFDYNAVTESLEEFQSAICLCGYSRCRGSFLHFATADCYQSVLNRNSPIAVRFANLVKGCNKKVMAEEDEKSLSTHGFGTAAFGAVSFSRNTNVASSSPQDVMENVPVWLRTYVCDVLRYIEYERRALPIALLCNDLKNKKEKQDESASKTKEEPKASRAKPENNFQFFVRKNKEKFLAKLGKKALKKMKGMEVQQAIRKVGSSEWRLLSSKQKEKWKQQAIAAWKKECSRDGKSKEKSPMQKGDKKSKKINEKHEEEKPDKLNLSKISFETADAEGSSAMEQRIQQVTQALSRIGRILDRHRERKKAIHAPLSIMTDYEVVSWIWIDKGGLVASLLGAIKEEKYAGDEVYNSLLKIKSKYDKLEEFVTKASQSSISCFEARKLLTEALLALRGCLHDGVQELVKEYRQFELQRSRFKSKARREQVKEDTRREVWTVLEGVVDDIVERFDSEKPDNVATSLSHVPLVTDEKKKSGEPTLSPRLEHYNYRWKLEAIADILLLYARTSTFFNIVPYSNIESTPVEVYARELGNKVPWSKILKTENANDDKSTNVELIIDPKQSKLVDIENRPSNALKTKREKKAKAETFCDPDEVVAKVNVQYTGDYIVSQLLQWFNGGIGQKQGLPEMVGCVVLPSIKKVIESTETSFGGKTKKTTIYKSQVRPRLFDWVRDPRQRGSPFSDELAKIFQAPNLVHRGEELEPFPLGSPVLDLLVMGDDKNINHVLAALDEDRLCDASLDKTRSTAATGLESEIDEAMPAQAVAHWVQCERPECLKWRRLPFYVDIDLLPEQFFCKDNQWNFAAQSCDAPEDEWDENDADLHNDGVVKKSDVDMITRHDVEFDNAGEPVETMKFEIGERFDVLRTCKDTYCTGEIVDVNFKTPDGKVKFHFPKVKEKFDEWIDVPSERVAPLFSKQAGKIDKPRLKEEKSAVNRTLVRKTEVVLKAKGTSERKRENQKKAPESSDVIATLLALRKSGVADSDDGSRNSDGEACKSAEMFDKKSSNQRTTEKENQPSSVPVNTSSEDVAFKFIQSQSESEKTIAGKKTQASIAAYMTSPKIEGTSLDPSGESKELKHIEPQISPNRIPRKRSTVVPAQGFQQTLLNDQHPQEVRPPSDIGSPRRQQYDRNLETRISAKNALLYQHGRQKSIPDHNSTFSSHSRIENTKQLSGEGNETKFGQVAGYSMNVANESSLPQNKCQEDSKPIIDQSYREDKFDEKRRESQLLSKNNEDGRWRSNSPAKGAHVSRHQQQNLSCTSSPSFVRSGRFQTGHRGQSISPHSRNLHSTVQRQHFTKSASSPQKKPRIRYPEDRPETAPTSLSGQHHYQDRPDEMAYQSQSLHQNYYSAQQQNHRQDQFGYMNDFYRGNLQHHVMLGNNNSHFYENGHQGNPPQSFYGDIGGSSVPTSRTSGHELEPTQPKPNALGLHPLLGSRFVPKQK
mmetsp:Transcript_10662/g.16290  ORF Transcript_10662/g.16290 Transcript_10662/m.16290 type:complete len:2385 (+) Transcript_10662:186-7340(+)